MLCRPACRHRRFSLVVLAALLIAALPHAAARAQSMAGSASTAPAAAAADRDDEPRGSFGESIEVRLIDIEVVVTDAQGQRVTGLGRDDLRLRVDGREVPITFFDEVREGHFVASPTAAAGGDGGGGETAAAAARPVETSYLLFIDDYFTRPPYRNLVLDHLEDELSGTGPKDRFAVVAYDGRRLDVLSDWSTSRADLLDALAAARQRKGWKAYLEQQGRKADPSALARLRAEQLGRTYKAVTTTLRTFADVPGRRVALLVAGGWPYELNSIAFADTLGRSRLFDTRRPLARIADVANATGFTLYPIDAPGPENAGGGISAADRESALDSSFDDDVEGSLQEESLLRLAEWTGGEALLDNQRLHPLAPVVSDTRSYYWLSFQYPRSADGAHHTVQVEAARPGLEVRAREGFLDISRGAEAEIQAERALLLGGEEPTLEVEVADPVRRGRRMDVPFTVWVPLDEVTVAPRRGGGGRVRLELRVAVEDARGDRSDISVQKLDLPLEPAMLDLHAVAYDAAIELRHKEHVLVFVLSEPASGRSWFARQEVAP